MTTPLVSCVMAARGSLPALKEAVRCYCEQTYARRELIVAVARDARYVNAVEEFVSSLGRDDIRVLALDGVRGRGADPMAEALGAAAGEVVCVWADNERSHPARLQVQVNHLTASGVGWSVMTERLVYLLPERQLYWVAAHSAEAAQRFGVAETLTAFAGEFAERWGRPLFEDEAGPAAAHLLPADSAFLAVRVFGDLLNPHARPDETLLTETCHDNDACRARAGLFRIVLAQSRLPRPCLVRAPSEGGGFVTVEVHQ